MGDGPVEELERLKQRVIVAAMWCPEGCCCEFKKLANELKEADRKKLWNAIFTEDWKKV